MEEALKDERFGHILSDPRFRKMPKHVRKMTIGKRFKKMFKDESFKEKCALDKRGRPLNLTPSENLKKLYNIASESEDEEENEDSDERKDTLKQNATSQQKSDCQARKSNAKANKSEKIIGKDTKTVLLQKTEENDSEESDDDDDSESNNNIEDKTNDALKRKESNENENLHIKDMDESSSEESDDSDSVSDDSDGNQSDDIDHRWEELRNEAPDTNEISRRIAVCNMDWDRIRAVDLLVCFNSFKPSEGCINSVRIYPSEFGLKRMEEEKLNGPLELVEEKLASDEEELEDKKKSKYHREKLRQYQINRLKYYYAVVECDSPETANALYEELNGIEYESSSVLFDLRFIPDDVTFDHEPTSVADKIPDSMEYKPRLFVTSALQQVKVGLTWDETDPKRKEFFQKIFTDPDSVQNDLDNYIASASSESEGEENTAEKPNQSMKTKERIAVYKELLLSLEEKEKKEYEEKHKFDMEFVWEPALKEKTKEQVKEKIKNNSLNPFEELLQKKKEERRMRKKEQKAKQRQTEDSLSDDSEEESPKDNTSKLNKKPEDEKKLAELALITDCKKVVDIEEKSRKRTKKDKSKELDEFEGDPNDPRFAAMYTSSLFNVITSDTQGKKNNRKFAGKSEKRKRKPKFQESYKKNKY